MSGRMLSLVAVLVAFAALTVLALQEVGYVGLVAPLLQSWGGGQVLADLVIALWLACLWMISDARSRGISPWPFVAVTLLAGSFGVLGYLLLRELRGSARAAVARA